MTSVATEDSGKADDLRLYVPNHEDFTAAIKQDWSKEYCFYQRPGESYYHLLLNGEIYLQHGDEKLCLNCAFRHGHLSRNRAYWQKGPSSITESYDVDGPAGSQIAGNRPSD